MNDKSSQFGIMNGIDNIMEYKRPFPFHGKTGTEKVC